MRTRANFCLAILLLTFLGSSAFCQTENIQNRTTTKTDFTLQITSVPESGLVLVPVRMELPQTDTPEQESIITVTRENVPVCSQFVSAHGLFPPMLLIQLSPEQKQEAQTTGLSLDTHYTTRPMDSQDVQEYTLDRTQYSLKFQADRQGGFPLNITFKNTGFSTEMSRWSERLYHPETGSWELSGDTQATTTLLSDGPLATVLELNAKFVPTMETEHSQLPSACYRFFCFKNNCFASGDEPIYVMAQYQQETPKFWRELHFMEIHPGKDFTRWRSITEPGGDFTYKQNSYSTPNAMGLLANEKDMIVVAGENPMVWDGTEDSYIMPDSTFCWSPWSTTKTGKNNLLAFTSLKKDETPTDYLKRIESESHFGSGFWSLPLSKETENDWQKQANKFSLLYGITPSEKSDESIALESSDLGLIMTRHNSETGQRLALTQLVDRRTATPLLFGGKTPLFRMKYEIINDKKTEICDSLGQWSEIKIEPFTNHSGCSITFQKQLPEAMENSTISVCAQISTEKNEPGITISFDCNVPDTLRVLEFEQGCLEMARFGSNMKLFYPTNSGVIHDNPFDKSLLCKGTYPTGWCTMAYMALWDETSHVGLYCSANDPHGDLKNIYAKTELSGESISYGYVYPSENLTQAGNGFHPTGAITLRAFNGDWYDAALIYRDWVRKNADWYPLLGRDGREDSPLWLRRHSLWGLVWADIPNMPERMKKFQEAFGVNGAIHWYGWNTKPFDNDYPHFYPTDGFADAVAEIQKDGNFFVMPYINGRLWDQRDNGLADEQFTSLARPSATSNQDGNLITERYESKEDDGSPVEFSVMCPQTELWQNKVRENVLRLTNENNTAGVYIDQIAAAEPVLCCNESHGHPTGGGAWWVKAQKESFNRIRTDLKKTVDNAPLSPWMQEQLQTNPNALSNRMITTECNAEPYMNLFDAYLTWHWQNQNAVPAFSAVYSGAIALFGRSYAGNATAWRMKAAQSLTFGEQIGWFDDSVINDAEKFNFIKSCVMFRDQHIDYFYRGIMVRPPHPLDPIPVVTEDWQWAGQPTMITEPVVRGAAWLLPDYKTKEETDYDKRKTESVLIFFTNMSNQDVTARMELDLDAWHVTPETHNLYRTDLNQGNGESTPLDWSLLQEPQHFPPQSVSGWEIRVRR